jgi:hypothetical protein
MQHVTNTSHVECECALHLARCMWPGQCESDIARYAVRRAQRIRAFAYALEGTQHMSDLLALGWMYGSVHQLDIAGHTSFIMLWICDCKPRFPHERRKGHR